MPKYKTVAELREEARYHGDPSGGASTPAGARKFADRAFTSDSDYMKDAVTGTAEALRKAATPDPAAIMGQEYLKKLRLKYSGLAGRKKVK